MPSTNRRLMLCVPCGEGMKIRTFTSIFDLQALLIGQPEFPGHRWDIIDRTCAEGSILPGNRQRLVETALERDAADILFIDTDIAFHPAVPLRMSSRDKDVVICNYRMRFPPPLWTCWGLDERRVSSAPPKEGIEKIHSGGLGMALIRAEVFRAIPRPWFSLSWEERDGDWHWTAEDGPFFERVRDRGFDVWVDHDASQHVAHMGIYPYTWSDFDASEREEDGQEERLPSVDARGSESEEHVEDERGSSGETLESIRARLEADRAKGLGF